MLQLRENHSKNGRNHCLYKAQPSAGEPGAKICPGHVLRVAGVMCLTENDLVSNDDKVLMIMMWSLQKHTGHCADFRELTNKRSEQHSRLSTCPQMHEAQVQLAQQTEDVEEKAKNAADDVAQTKQRIAKTERCVLMQI